ncbi:ABC transporter, permease protein [Croceitalea dokdonensis DOKDO 023]|uniref:ABC transporter, permease protein n=1 Tax=Croceitalea dokdonensis DOKDO 023 TaxID=1300341 RepID=A0A0P7ASH5_9FLAO|nr:ABC transporter permease [Croceitalea dokdonensis]KPM31368.1 ABC transporter, permease protein [Croceitalea dokdonensis DOKDO 023]
MFNRDRWKEILEVLTKNWFRTLLTAFGVFWGILILIILLSAGKGLENGIKQDFSGVATNTMFMWTQTTTMAYQGLPEGRNFNFKLGDVGLIKDNVPNLRIVSPRNGLRNQQGVDNVFYKNESGSYRVFGDYPEIIFQNSMYVNHGRFLNYDDIKERRKVIVIGDGIRKDLYKETEEVLGTYLKIQGVNFMVVGTYKEKSSNGNGENAERQIYIPFTTFSQAFNRADNVGWMAITAKDGFSISQLLPKVVSTVKESRKVNPKDERAIGYFDLYEQFNRVESLFAAMRWIAIIVGTLVLISGVIGVSNIMLIVVKERTKEIGIRRALGEDPWSIKKQILMESIFLTIISGMTGIIFGALFIYGMNALLDSIGPVDMFLNPSVSVGVVLMALAVLIISGLFAGFIPAQSAIKVKPIDALRTE